MIAEGIDGGQLVLSRKRDDQAATRARSRSRDDQTAIWCARERGDAALDLVGFAQIDRTQLDPERRPSIVGSRAPSARMLMRWRLALASASEHT